MKRNKSLANSSSIKKIYVNKANFNCSKTSEY